MSFNRDRQVHVWISVRHGKNPGRRKIVAGVIPKGIKGKDMRWRVKEAIMREYLSTGRLVTHERVGEIVKAEMFAAVLA